MPMTTDFFLVTELQTDTLTEGKTFDGFVAGNFIDMRGRRILVEEDELEDYVANTQAAIEATESESGEIVGLPIDVFDHDKEDAAGWIVGVSLSDGVVRLDPKWTAVGKDLIEEGIRRFFSATFNTDQQVILGGTLTNWPATRDDGGRILLRPIELSRSMFSVEHELASDTESTEDRLNRIQADFREQFPNFDNRPYVWIEDTFDEEGFVIVDEGARHFRVGFSETDDGDFDFADRTEWVEVKQTWIDAARKAARDIIMRGPLGRAAAALSRRESGKKKRNSHGGGKMKVKLDDLSPDQKSELALGLFADLAGEDYSELDLGERFNSLVESRAATLVEKQTVKAARESDIAEFSKDVTGGTDESPLGIPVTQEEVERFLAMLSDEALTEAKRIFGKIQTEGLVTFTENGHGRKVKGAKELPEEYAEKLESGEMTVDDLKEPVLGLGGLSAYDLSKYKEKEA